MQKTLADILEHQTFRNNVLPYTLTEEMKRVLDSGILYIHGRDRWFRPVVVYTSSVLNNLDVDRQVWVDTSMFACFYVINNLLCPGKVENWTLINDLNNLAISKLPVKFIINFLKTLQTHLKCRGRAFVVLKVTWAIRAIWATISPFVDDRIKK